MSTSLYWRPSPPPTDRSELPFQLKKAISQRYWGHDGSLWGDEQEIGKDDLPYLEGLADGMVDGAEELIEAIRKHGSVLIRISG